MAERVHAYRAQSIIAFDNFRKMAWRILRNKKALNKSCCLIKVGLRLGDEFGRVAENTVHFTLKILSCFHASDVVGELAQLTHIIA